MSSMALPDNFDMSQGSQESVDGIVLWQLCSVFDEGASLVFSRFISLRVCPKKIDHLRRQSEPHDPRRSFVVQHFRHGIGCFGFDWHWGFDHRCHTFNMIFFNCVDSDGFGTFACFQKKSSRSFAIAQQTPLTCPQGNNSIRHPHAH